jgi:cephalosporin-C deacetylase-like acetyl esterase
MVSDDLYTIAGKLDTLASAAVGFNTLGTLDEREAHGMFVMLCDLAKEIEAILKLDNVNEELAR